MPITILNNLLRSARNSSGTLVCTTGLRGCKSECLRNLQTQADLKSQEEQNDSVLYGKSASLRRALTGREEGWRLFGTEQAERVVNYYKKRWVSNGAEQASTESSLNGPLDTDSFAERKSLYSQWAAMGPSRKKDPAIPPKAFKAFNEFVVSSNHDPFRHQEERKMSAKTKQNDCGEGRERSLDRLKRPLTAPMFWQMDKHPLDCLSNNEHGTSTTRTIAGQKCNTCESRMETARPSTDDYGNEYSGKEEEKAADEETAGQKCLHKKRNRTRPTTAAAVPMNFLPDDIPLFDVNTLKKKYVFGGRLKCGQR